MSDDYNLSKMLSSKEMMNKRVTFESKPEYIKLGFKYGYKVYIISI